DDHVDEVVQRGLMDDLAGREAKGRAAGELAALVFPTEKESRRSAEVIADDEIADAAEDEPEREAGRGRVHHVPEVQMVLPHVRVRGCDPAEDPAVEHDAALPDAEDVDRVRALAEVEVEVTDDVEEARADHHAGDRPHQHVPNVLFGDAVQALRTPRQQGAARGVPCGDPEPVRGHGYGAQLHAGDDFPTEIGDRPHRAQRYHREGRPAAAPGRTLAVWNAVSSASRTSTGSRARSGVSDVSA